MKWQNKKKYNKKTYTHARTYTRIAKVVNSSSLLLLWCLCQHTRRHTPTCLHIVQVVCGAVYVCDCAPLIAKESESEREGEREQSLSLVFIFFSPRVFIYLFFSNNFRIVKSFFSVQRKFGKRCVRVRVRRARWQQPQQSSNENNNKNNNNNNRTKKNKINNIYRPVEQFAPLWRGM